MQTRPRMPIDDFEILIDQENLLGQGTFAKVYRAINTKTQKTVAVKIIDKKLWAQNEKLKEYFIFELNTMKKIKSWEEPFFVKIIHHFSDSDFEFVFMDYCDRSLYSISQKENLSTTKILEVIFQVGIGIKKMHSEKIIHRDLKLQNILISGETCKIIDFGLSTGKMNPGSFLGTMYYVAPEIISNSGTYDNKVDVWAINTMLYRLLAREFYFNGKNAIELRENIMRQPFIVKHRFSGKWNEELKDLLAKGFIKQFWKRPNINEYLAHPVFDDLRQKYQKFFSPIQNPDQKNRKLTNLNNFNKISNSKTSPKNSFKSKKRNSNQNPTGIKAPKMDLGKTFKASKNQNFEYSEDSYQTKISEPNNDTILHLPSRIQRETKELIDWTSDFVVLSESDEISENKKSKQEKISEKEEIQNEIQKKPKNENILCQSCTNNKNKIEILDQEDFVYNKTQVSFKNSKNREKKGDSNFNSVSQTHKNSKSDEKNKIKKAETANRIIRKINNQDPKNEIKNSEKTEITINFEKMPTIIQKIENYNKLSDHLKNSHFGISLLTKKEKCQRLISLQNFLKKFTSNSLITAEKTNSNFFYRKSSLEARQEFAKTEEYVKFAEQVDRQTEKNLKDYIKGIKKIRREKNNRWVMCGLKLVDFDLDNNTNQIFRNKIEKTNFGSKNQKILDIYEKIKKFEIELLSPIENWI